jgi:hypothetical protein
MSAIDGLSTTKQPCVDTVLGYEFDEKNQNEPWKNDVAADLNTLLGMATYERQTDNPNSEDFVLATVRQVSRISEFESIALVVDGE